MFACAFIGIETYCVITCEGEKVRSAVSTKANPEWNVYAVFYRKYPLKKPLTVEVGFNVDLAHKKKSTLRVIIFYRCVFSVKYVMKIENVS